MMRNMRDEVKEMLMDMDDCDLVAIHNEYCEKVNYVDDMIYSMGEFDEIYPADGKSALDIIRDAMGGSFNPDDDWFRWNGWGNLDSTDTPDEGDWIDIDEIADYIVENDDALRNDEIRDLMDEIEEENEEEEEEEEEEE